MNKTAEKLKEAIADADAVVLGAGAGLSTSAGFTYAGKRFERYFGDFSKRYGFRDMYSGGFSPFASPEESWAYWSRNIWINRYSDPPKPVYNRLYELLDGRDGREGAPKKDYFVITTNVDHCFQKAGFDKERLFYTQGDYGLWQCSKPCHHKTYDNKEAVREMLLSQGFEIKDDELVPPADLNGATDYSRLKMRVPSELVPKCPVCGRPMSMNLRVDDTFVEDSGWHKASERYSDFLSKRGGRKVLFLELGVGSNTPVIIKYPFWRMTAADPDAFYACVNYNEAFCPDEIADRSLCINGDISEIFS